MRHQGREVALMALYALDGLPSFERQETLRRLTTIFDYREIWEVLFSKEEPSSHPLQDPPMWVLADNLPLEAPRTSVHKLPSPYNVAFRFAEEMIAGVLLNLATIDPAISDASKGWRINRMAQVDRNILRIGTYELLFCPDVPDPVAINEALELCKQYAEIKTPPFVNGILDRIRKNKRHGNAPAVVIKR